MQKLTTLIVVAGLVSFTSVSFISSAFSAINLKPGLWEVKTKMKSGGREIDPHAEMKKAMEKMSPERRKQIEGMMAKMGAGVSKDNSVKICMTQEMLNQDDALVKRVGRNCETAITSKTATKVEVKFDCKDGTNGTSVWNMVDSSHYSGEVNMTNSKGVATEITHSGVFVASDCGSIKPIDVKKYQKK